MDASRRALGAVFAVLAMLAAAAPTWGDDKKPQKAAPPPKTTHPASNPAATAKPGTHPATQGSNAVRPGQSGPGAQSGNARGGHPPAVIKDLRTTGARPVPHGGTAGQVQLASGKTGTVLRRSNGRVAAIQTNGLTVNHPLRGPRTVVAERNGKTIVAVGRQGGYVQRPYFSRGGRDYVQRTYVVGGVSQVSVYRAYNYGGVVYYGYVPAYYYSPVYYGWAYNPWAAPAYYGPAAWGWAGSPWYGYYGGYFTPYPAYGTASEWLTDFVIAADLQAAYAAKAEADAAAASGQADAAAAAPVQPSRATQLTPEVKQLIAEQVKQQLAAEQAAARPQQAAPSNAQTPDALNPAERIFIVHSNVEAATAAGKECVLTAGDVLMRTTDSPDENQNVKASVKSSKQTDCASGQSVLIAVQDLQEMHNQFRQQVDSGLTSLANNAGKGGLPQAPDTTTTGGEVPLPKPDSAAAAQLEGAQRDADETERAVQNAGNAGS